MATKKDLVEAHAFSRRRLVTAFLSGAPGGREVEPSRPGRVIVGGIALSILLVAGAAIASVLAARTPADWQKPGIVVTEGTGTKYVILDPEKPVLHPILNDTSAQLIFGADKQAITVAKDDIDKETPGETLGIFNAPIDLPTTDRLVNTGWTACTGDNLGIRIDVSSQPQAESGLGLGVTVEVEETGTFYLVAVGDDDGTPGAHFYEVPDSPSADLLLSDLGAPPRTRAMKVPAAWVRLFPAGKALQFDSFGFDPASGPVPAASEQVPKAIIGAFAEDGDGSGAGKVITPQGLLTLTPFQLAVYRRSTLPDGAAPRDLGKGASLGDTNFTQPTVDAAHWPQQLLRGGIEVRQACAVLAAAAGERPGVRLGVEPFEVASAASLESTEATVHVDPGHGAFVHVGGFEDSSGGAPWVVSSQGKAYPVLDEASVTRLTYDSVTSPVVPDPWIKLFIKGVTLSTGAALCPPVDPDGPDGDDPPDQYCPGPDESPTSTASPGTSAEG